MEENILIKSKHKTPKILFIIIAVITIIGPWFLYSDRLDYNIKDFYEYRQTYIIHSQYSSCEGLEGVNWVNSDGLCWDCRKVKGVHSAIGYHIRWILDFTHDYTGRCLLFYGPMIFGLLVIILLHFLLRRYELTVTDKRVYGKTIFSKRVDLPLDSITAISANRLFYGVSVSTPSGRISFNLIENANKIYEVINDLLIKRQKELDASAANAINTNDNVANQLVKYKELLDMGIISQEEFDKKKKQLLNL